MLDGARGLRALDRAERFAVAGITAAAALATHQWMPAIVAAVTLVRAVSSDAHPQGDRRMFVLFAVLVVALSILATLPVVRGMT
jgi:hypothetical protein